jgi:hypothetical protein
MSAAEPSGSVASRFERLLEIALAHSNRSHPRSCRTCGRLFEDLRAYFEATTTVGTPQCYDLPDPNASIGTLALVNCACGTTLGIHADVFNAVEYPEFLALLDQESHATGAPPSEVLEHLRQTLRARVMGRPPLAP